ncbi:hypothetical protein HI113_44600 [Corallococcus exiguus]|nr:hypothetical protein [Corallococcus exiguus]
MVKLDEGPYEGAVLGVSFAGSTREYLLTTPLGAIKAEVDASETVHPLGASLKFDLPVEVAAPLRRFA